MTETESWNSSGVEAGGYPREKQESDKVTTYGSPEIYNVTYLGRNSTVYTSAKESASL